MAAFHDGWPKFWPQYAVPDRFDKPLMQPERGPATANAAAPQRVTVSVNTLIVRTDLGAGKYTYVAANSKVPIGLEGFARIPA